MQGGQAMAVFREERRDGLVAVGVTVDCVTRNGKAVPRFTPWKAVPSGNRPPASLAARPDVVDATYQRTIWAFMDESGLQELAWEPMDWEFVRFLHPAIDAAARVDLGPDHALTLPEYDWTSPAFVAACEGLGLSPLSPPASPPSSLAICDRAAPARPLRRAGPRPVGPLEKISIEDVLWLEKKNTAFGQKLLAAVKRVFRR